MIFSFPFKPLYLGLLATLSGGAAIASVIKLEASHSPIKDNASKLASSIYKFLETSPKESSKSPTPKIQGSAESQDSDNSISDSRVSSTLSSGIQSAKEVYEGLNSLIQNQEVKSKMTPAQLLESLKELYSDLKKSGEGESDSESSKIQLWTKTIQEWYKKQTTSTNQKSS